MLPFATEFPIQPFEHRTAFVAEVIAWLKGIERSTLLTEEAEADLDSDNAHLLSGAGEELKLREFRQDDTWNAIGFRHDLPDEFGRLWRTECVLRRMTADDTQDLIRLRTQCIAQSPGVQLMSPRKPYLVKAFIKQGWGGEDGMFKVSDQPIWLKSDEADIAVARALTLGEGSRWLPIVYISAIGDGDWVITKDSIEKLAYDLGGVAHVVVEPDRVFSFRLRHETDAQNAYGGTVGLALPESGLVRRFYIGWQIQNGDELAAAIRVGSSSLRGQMPCLGWDWTELQEQALRAQRDRERNRLTAEESEKLFDKEIENLQDRILQLEVQLRNRPISGGIGTDEGEFSAENLVRLIGPEIYPGEISDRLRYASKIVLEASDRIGLDTRSKVIFERLVKRLLLSPSLRELRQDLQRSTNDAKRLAVDLTTLLTRHGYLKKSDNKHIRLEAKNGFDGLDAVTIPKTPSDYRSVKNLRKQIENKLGITKLSA